MDNDRIQFHDAFRVLTGNAPFPWQQALYGRFIADGRGNIPATCNLPTGLGKTSVIAVWLIALVNHPDKMPRRLVYVVNRRTVVDQTTAEVESYRKRIELLGDQHALKLRIGTLAISTLRGQFADNREWSGDPSRPAVICGTVDMIGSRLLFSGYGVGFKAKPLHAGFLGQDALLVHDEAHLEPAFQRLIESIRNEQANERRRNGDPPWPPLRVMELTATTRSDDTDATALFSLQPDDRDHPIVMQRIEAAKRLQLPPAKDDGKIAEEIADLALKQRWVCDENNEPVKDENGNLKDANAAVLVFARTLDDVKKICGKLTSNKDGVPDGHVQPLTGTMRGLERDRMADPRRPGASRVFARFLKQPKPDAPESERWKIERQPGTVYLVCTSAGEVGIDISADHMVCDLSTFESMAQRFGRVNRYGERADTRIDVVHPVKFDDKDKLTPARKATLALLEQLEGDASPAALGHLDPKARAAAFAPPPTIPPATDILFDAWALTSIRETMPGRPPVEPYLHGIAEWEPPQTQVAWREEVGVITGNLLERYPLADLLDDYPLLPHELLRDRSDRVLDHLQTLASKHPFAPVWLIDLQGSVIPSTLGKLADPSAIKAPARKPLLDRIERGTLLLPPSIGGLSTGGNLDGDSPRANDVSDDDSVKDEKGRRLRHRVWDDESPADHLRPLRTIDTSPDAEEEDAGGDAESSEALETDKADEPAKSARRRFWHWYDTPVEGGRTASKPVTWETHVGDVVNHVKRIVAGLSLPQDIADAIILAAELHDHGKRRERFQLTLGNRWYPRVLLAKSGKRGPRLPEPFRHEFASVLDAQTDAGFNALSDEMKDLVLHLIAAHHGRARPHFPIDEAFDPDRPQSDADALAVQTPRRFARLQRRYGRWGLAYLESILRAADWAASAEPSKVLDANGNEVTP